MKILEIIISYLMIDDEKFQDDAEQYHLE